MVTSPDPGRKLALLHQAGLCSKESMCSHGSLSQEMGNILMSHEVTLVLNQDITQNKHGAQM